MDELPAYRWKSPLQRAVQVLKRHRDVMFADNSASQPISIIITTLAGRAYNGDANIASALRHILATMGNHVNGANPRVPNPVNPAEDFADKWGDAAYRHLQLEEHFWFWLRRANADFQALDADRDESLSLRRMNESFRTAMNSKTLASVGSAASLLRPATTPSADLSFPPKPLVPNKPAGFASLT